MIKFSLIFTLVLMAAGLTSCSTDSKKEREEEISLKGDRKLLDQYRTEIPEDIRKENDYMALVLKDMAELKMSPQQVRDRYYKETRRKRDAFNTQHRRMREKFNRGEKKKRDEFLNNLKKERAEFVKDKHGSKENSEFFSEQNTKRNMYFQDQSDRRKEFESQMDQERRDFNDDMNLKQKQFDDAHREYLKNYQEKEKQKKLERLQPKAVSQTAPATEVAVPAPVTYPGQDKDIEEFDSMKDSGRDSF